ncbi:MAG TPA: GAP family protein [Gaiellaceae bacterium]|nr:GAP family protein [Gaiellaceae bacterium]
MGTLVAEVAALGLAVAFTSPVSVVTVIVLLSLPAGRRRGLAFLVGWLIALAVIAALMLFVLHGQDFGSRSSTPSRAASALEVLLGSLLLIWAVVAYRRREPSSGGASTPSWLGRIEGTHWLLALAVGALMLSYGLSLAAASEILKANVSRLDATVAITVFALTSMVTVAAPIVVVVAAPERSEQRLATWKAWLLGNSRVVTLVVLMVVAALLIVRGVHDLVA